MPIRRQRLTTTRRFGPCLPPRTGPWVLQPPARQARPLSTWPLAMCPRARSLRWQPYSELGDLHSEGTLVGHGLYHVGHAVSPRPACNIDSAPRGTGLVAPSLRADGDIDWVFADAGESTLICIAPEIPLVVALQVTKGVAFEDLTGKSARQ